MSTLSRYSVQTEIAPPERVAVGRLAVGTETRRRIGLLLTDLNGGGIQKMMRGLKGAFPGLR